MVHSLAASKLQSNLEYKRQSKEDRAHYKIHADQPEFLQAKKSQAQTSDITYRNRLHDYTCDPEQLNIKHAKKAYKLQSDVSGLKNRRNVAIYSFANYIKMPEKCYYLFLSNCKRCCNLYKGCLRLRLHLPHHPSQVNYKSDLNWIKGVGWTPPGSHKAELARRAAELGLAEGVSTDEAIAKYQQMMMVRKCT